MWPPALCLLAGFLLQNLGEWRGGGPVPPAALRCLLRRDLGAPVPRRALLLITALIAAGLLAGAACQGAKWSAPLLALIAGGLAANALAQPLASLRRGRLMPGTLPGLAFMLPAAIWLAARLAWPWPQLLAGALLSPVVLALVWWMAGWTGRNDRTGPPAF